jgi:hypothetical protein
MYLARASALEGMDSNPRSQSGDRFCLDTVRFGNARLRHEYRHIEHVFSRVQAGSIVGAGRVQ